MKKITNLLNELKMEGFVPRLAEHIKQDIEWSFDGKVSIIQSSSERRFAIEYNCKTEKCELQTAFSNQVVDMKYMEDIQKLFQLVEKFNK